MTVRLTPLYFERILNAVFSDSAYVSSNWATVYAAFLCGGTMPANPLVTTGFTTLSGGVIVDGGWLPPSDGVCTLSNPVAITPNANGTITFIRLCMAGSTTGVIDISVGLVGSGASCIVSSLTAVSGTPVAISDLRVKLNTTGDFSVGATIANDFLLSLLNTNRDSRYIAANAASRLEAPGGAYTKAVTVNVYDGPIPAKADDAATGTRLWTKAITGNNLFNVSGLGMSLAEALTANALASGTPTYARVVKAAYSGVNTIDGLTYSWPATVFQLPIGPPTNGCIMTPGVLVSGQSATITNMTVTLQP